MGNEITRTPVQSLNTTSKPFSGIFYVNINYRITSVIYWNA